MVASFTFRRNQQNVLRALYPSRRILGTKHVYQVLESFSIFRKMPEGYADRARQTLKLLKDPETASLTIVTTPFKALRDGECFLSELTRRKFFVNSLLLIGFGPIIRKL